MRTIYKYLSIVAAGLAIASCDDFLDKEPIDQIASEVYFKDEASAEAGVRGVYRSLGSAFYYGQSMIIVPEFAAGSVQHIGAYPEYTNFTTNEIRIDNPWTLNIWTASYSTINAANAVIENVPAIESGISDAKRDQLVREAKFIRALVYFNLVRSWSDVPLVLTSTNASTSLSDLKVSRTPAADVYAQVVKDLSDATELPASYTSVDQTKGRATKQAAQALLAKVNLYQGHYAEAASLARSVIDASGPLVTDYASIWLTKNGGESIFELQFDAQLTNPLAPVTNLAGTTQPTFSTDTTAYKMFETGDIRRDVAIKKNGTRYYIGKFPNYNPAIQNFPMIRLAEVYLIYAEAQARDSKSVAGDPYKYYAAVRTRAGLTTPDESTFTNVDEFVKDIQREKRKELLFEGEAWYDYTRTGLALDEMMVKPEAGRFLFPIPQSERELNTNLSQNAAYL
jgi:hypothetical protein